MPTSTEARRPIWGIRQKSEHSIIESQNIVLLHLLSPTSNDHRFEYDTDKDIVQLKFVSASDGQPIGLLNWYAVHLTSMNNTNTLISSDNKGYAALRFEAQMNGEAALPGKVSYPNSFNLTLLITFLSLIFDWIVYDWIFVSRVPGFIDG